MQSKRRLSLLVLLLVAGASLVMLGRPVADRSDFGPTRDEPGASEPDGPDRASATAGPATADEAGAGTAAGVEPPARTEIGPQPEAWTAPEPRPEVRIHGRVTDGASTPVAGAEVRVTIRRRDRPRSQTQPNPVTTGADGTFAFEARGYRDLGLLFDVRHPQFAVGVREDSFQAVASGQELGVGDLQLVGGGAVRGGVTDQEGNAVPGATVRLHPQDGALRRHPERWVLFPRVAVDGNGRFAIGHVPAGQYRVDAEAPQRQRQYTEVITVADGEAVLLESIQLVPRVALTGRVSGADGEPIAAARVAVLRVRGGSWQDTQTDDDGWFRFDHLLEDVYTVAVEAKGWLRLRRHGICVPESPRVDLTLTPGLAIRGIVRDHATGQTVDVYAARVRLLHTFEDLAASNQRSEFFALVDRLAQQRAQLRGGERQQFDREMELQVREQARRLREQGIDVDTRGERGERGDEQHGRDAGEPAGGPVDAGEPEAHAGGRFAFAGLQAGVYVVEVGSPRHQRLRSQEVELRQGATSPELALSLARGLVVSGRVVDEVTGEPVRDARVDLMVPRVADGARLSPERALRARLQPGAGATHFLDTRTDASGGFRFEQAAAGTYVLMARASGRARACSDAFALSSDADGFELALGRAGVLHGRVAGIPADAWEHARVVVTNLREERTVNVEADLTYRIEDLAPGKYLVRGCVGSQDVRERATARWLERLVRDADTIREDVEVGPAAAIRFDVWIEPVPTGDVAGQVLVEGVGRDGHGCRVCLRELQVGEAGAGAPAPRRFAAHVDQDGDYELREVPAGRYRMSVRAEDQDGREVEVWHGEVLVQAGHRNVQVPIELTAADLGREPR